MRLTLTEKFQKDCGTLSKSQREQLFAVMLKLPQAMRDSHRHTGVGLRKLHPSGIFEARLGLGLRLLFAYKSQEIILHRIGNHDQIKKYLKTL